jgi:hypothetical protein
MESINTPQYAQISNVFMKTNDNSQCNPFKKSNNFGNYFQQCSQGSESALWGNNKPVPDKCGTLPHTGTPCHSLWNNLTKRKSVVDYKREPVNDLKSLSLTSKPFYYEHKPLDYGKALVIPPSSCKCNCN